MVYSDCKTKNDLAIRDISVYTYFGIMYIFDIEYQCKTVGGIGYENVAF